MCGRGMRGLAQTCWLGVHVNCRAHLVEAGEARSQVGGVAGISGHLAEAT